MKIKKYDGATEKEAMEKVKEELGKEALIVSIKNIKPKGFYKIFKKPYVEVIAALDDKDIFKNEKITTDLGNNPFVQSLKTFPEIKKCENEEIKPIPKYVIEKEVVNNELSFIKVIYEQLLDSEVDEAYINQLMVGLSEISYDYKADVNDVVSIVYKRIIKLLSDVETIKIPQDETKIVAFIGPTGVGKTTTIAKIASYFTLNLQKKVALITADTYRIAAVEQIRTYANILNIPIKVVYTATELKEAIDSFKHMDLVLIDTAGRSHKNIEHKNELSKLLNEIPDKEIYLVLSLATKYKDLIKITNAYNDISEYKLIFTKLDETSNYGNILNIKLQTNAMLSYITFGQNVPDDISELNVHEIAKKILGGCE